jgi:hypothetical protein
MIAFIIPIGALAMTVLGGLGALVAAVVTALGLAGKRKALWITAATSGLVFMLLGVAGASMLASAAAHAAKETAKNVVVGGLRDTFAEVKAGSDSNARKWFDWGTGVNLPADARYLAGRDYLWWWSDIYLKLQVPPNFRDVLGARMDRPERPPHMTLSDYAASAVARDIPEWDTAVTAQGMQYFEIATGDVDHGGFRTQIALDVRTGTMYCHIVEYVP